MSELGRDYLQDEFCHEAEPPTWTTKEGEEIRVRDMDDDHLLNTIVYLERTYGHEEYLPFMWEDMEDERIRRGLDWKENT